MGKKIAQVTISRWSHEQDCHMSSAHVAIQTDFCNFAHVANGLVKEGAQWALMTKLCSQPLTSTPRTPFIACEGVD